MIVVGVPAETYAGERRIALVPAMVPTLAKAGMHVRVQQGAGGGAGFPDVAYEAQGASVIPDRGELFSASDVVLQVHILGGNHGPGRADLELYRTGQAVIGLLNPLGAPTVARELADRGVMAFALELLPRISRAQPMDVLTSMATVAGYKAVVLAADALPKMFPMMITAAGTITPARVFVVGAGVAGLQAIATARRLGAVVQAYDVRPAVKEQVESLGARFVELALEGARAEGAGGYAQAMDEEFYRRQREMMTQVVADSDVVVTTAAVPGSRSPILVTKEMVERMRPGSVLVDLAAEGGGNCELTQPGETVVKHGVAIIGPINLPATIPYHASQMYSRNVSAFLQNLVKGGEVRLNLEDPILRETLVAHGGEVVNPRVRDLLGLPAISGERSGS